VVFSAMYAFAVMATGAVPAFTATLGILQLMMWAGMRLNLILAFFNLIPIPPLDGSHVFYHLLPPGAGLKYRQLYVLGFLPILLVSWVAPGVIAVFLWPAHRLLDLGIAIVGGLAIPGAM